MQKLPINPFLDFYSTPDAMIINPFVFGGGAFDPLTLSPALWLDASDASTLYDATSGGSLVAADGTIARINDKSGNSRHATQATSGSRPIRKVGIINGRDVMRFDGVDDSLLWTSRFSVGFDFTVFLVTTQSDAQAGYLIYLSEQTGATGTPQLGFISNYTTDDFETYGFIDPNTTRYTTAASTTGFSSLVLRKSGTALTSFYNANTGGSGALSSNVELFAGSVASALELAATFAKADIAEILVFPTALGTTDRQNVENYLNAKYNIY